jgi:hypothetical protein
VLAAAVITVCLALVLHLDWILENHSNGWLPFIMIALVVRRRRRRRGRAC